MARTKKTKPAPTKGAPIRDERWIHFYRQMMKIRLFEEQVNQLYMSAKMPGLAHLYIGQEAVAVGVCETLRQDDYITSTHFFGEGALGQGLLYECMNMASLWKLPVIYVCENNLYNEYTHYSETTAGEIRERAKAFEIPCEAIDGQDIVLVHAASQYFVERARKREGPSFLICNTYRFYGHHVGDVDRAYYRSKKEEEEWKNRRDPLKLLAQRLTKEKTADDASLKQIEDEIQRQIEAAVQFALNAPYPKPSEVEQDVYA